MRAEKSHRKKRNRQLWYHSSLYAKKGIWSPSFYFRAQAKNIAFLNITFLMPNQENTKTDTSNWQIESRLTWAVKDRGVKGVSIYPPHPSPIATKTKTDVLNPNRKKHSSQPFGRYGKPKSLVMGKNPCLMANPGIADSQCKLPKPLTSHCLAPLTAQQRWQIITVLFVTALQMLRYGRALL